jgi:DNA polymerase-1
MSKNKKKLIIIDGNALIHRSFHALPPTMKIKTGETTNAVYGFACVLLKAIREFKPEYIALTLDRKAPTFRHKQYKEYKATRVKAPDELYAQIPLVKELVNAFRIPIFELDGFEADDLIGTIVRAVDDDVEKIIVTGDMDTLQLVNGHTKVYTMSRGLSDSIVYDKQAVIDRYGLVPEQMIEYKALRGDPSDNIPGVKGIGEKTAVELLTDFKTLDGVYKNIKSDKIKERIRGLLEEHKEEAYLSRELATIACSAPIDFDLEKARFGNYKLDDVVAVFSRFEFKSLLSRLQIMDNSAGNKEKIGDNKIDKFERNKKEFDYKLINTEKYFKAFILKLSQQKSFTYDTETTTIDPITTRLLGISFSWEEGKANYLDFSQKKTEAMELTLFNYREEDRKEEISDAWLKQLKPIFENPKIKKRAHNAKFDIRVLRGQGIDVKGVDFDTMIASYLLNSGSRQHNLDSVTFSELGFEKISKDDLLGKGKEKVSFSEVQTERLATYSCEDADFTNRLYKKLKKQISDEGLDKLFEKIEMPLVPVLAQMEDNGIHLDSSFLEAMKKDISKRLSLIEKDIFKQAGIEFNIRSTQQLKEVLFDKLNIPTDAIKKTKTGFSTAADELDKLKEFHPIIAVIQEHRELSKLMSTYIEALPLLINEKTKRIHTSFNQTVTATGRLSSTEPNLQNIPVKTELGREIRKAFIAEKGYKLLALDYSQIELRLAAHMSGDKKMIKAFLDGADIHSSTAAEINQVDLKDVTKVMRREAKATNFGILYGQGPHGLATTADIPYWRAKEFIDQYFVVYKDVKDYIEKCTEEAREKGYAETLFGRRRYLPDLNSSVMMMRKAAERMAVNTPLQGTAADMIKVAMVEVEKWIEENFHHGEVGMLLQVHDELVFEVQDKLVEQTAGNLKKIMENVIKLSVPVVVDVKCGNNWGDLKNLDI